MRYTVRQTAKYAEDAMEMQERAYYEQALGTDAALRKQLEDYLNIRSALRMQLERSHDEEVFKEVLRPLNEQYFLQRKKRSFLEKLFGKK